MKAVMISIRPEWCEKIASGQKTIEVRKTRPNLASPFKCYIYETKGKTDTPWVDEDGHHIFRGSGRVIGEFVCDQIISTAPWRLKGNTGRCAPTTDRESIFETCSCLTMEEIEKYAGSENRILYGWHISELKIYDKPKDIRQFTRYSEKDIRPCMDMESTCHHETYDFSENTTICGIDYDGSHCPFIRLQKPPQSWCYVEELEVT